jgi:hypothetical protein
MGDLHGRKAAFDAFFAAAPTLPGAARLRAMAARALARQALWQASRAYDRGDVTGPDAIPVDELVAFALAVDPGARRLREWHGLQLRRRIGAGRSLWFVPFVATAAGHRVRSTAGRLRWRLRGV